MNQNMGRLIRYILIIQMLSGKKKFIPAEEPISYLNLQMELLGYKVGLSIRTLFLKESLGLWFLVGVDDIRSKSVLLGGSPDYLDPLQYK